MERVFSVPKSLGHENVNQFCTGFNWFKANALQGPGEPVVFDLSECNHIQPVGAVLLAAFRDELAQSRYKCCARTKSSMLGRALYAFGLAGKPEEFTDTVLEGMSKKAMPLRRCLNFNDIDIALGDLIKHICQKVTLTAQNKAAVAYTSVTIWSHFLIPSIFAPIPMTKASKSLSSIEDRVSGKA